MSKLIHILHIYLSIKLNIILTNKIALDIFFLSGEIISLYLRTDYNVDIQTHKIEKMQLDRVIQVYYN